MMYLALTNLIFLIGIFYLLRKNRQIILTDQDTGLLNKIGFERELKQAIALSQRKNGPASLAIIDLDKLKSINDAHGHLIGNKAVLTVAKHISQAIRPEDSAAKWGGDEYAIVFPLTDTITAKEIIENIRQKIQKEQMVPAKDILVSSSVGLVKYQPGENAHQWFHRADMALYKAKNTGRDNVKVVS